MEWTVCSAILDGAGGGDLEEDGQLTGVGLPPACHTPDILHTLLHSPVYKQKFTVNS